MSSVLQSALGGGRALLIGWLLPCFVNLLVFAFVVAPGVSRLDSLTGLYEKEPVRATLFVLTGTLVLGLFAAAIQSTLYRILQGYLGWPGWLFRICRARQLSRKHLLRTRIDAAILSMREATDGFLPQEQALALDAFRAHPVTQRFIPKDTRRGVVGLALLDEKLRRFPADDSQITATRLGNAIRRFEEYGHDRFRLDSQVLWHELTAVAPDVARKQVEDARLNVDFFVCLLIGHLLIAVSSGVEIAAGVAVSRQLVSIAATIVLPSLALLWYRVAVEATDDWAGAVRGLVNLSRQPLATAMGFQLPKSIADEREMWTGIVDVAQFADTNRAADIDRFRFTHDATQTP